ncbi:DUF4747 family protein [Gluconobacter oxydans]|uniref:DUF4747 family protein n=1 Tax=Gluconobacter oxydans TaxID=442 RepID=UPI0039E939DE
MSTISRTTACALSIDAHPHPPGIYVKTLTAASGKEVQARGEAKAKITAPTAVVGQEGVFEGRLLVWTEIDIKGRWLNKEKDEDLSPEEKMSINIPENAAPNYKNYNYVFFEKNHRLYIETMTDTKDTLGPITVRKIFSNLLSPERTYIKDVSFAVTLIPDEEAVEEILSLPHLRKLELQIRTPNPDHASPEARRRIHRMMEENNAHTWEQTIKKDNNVDRLTPSEEVKDLARVAAETGYVRGEEKPRGGRARVVATDNRPKQWWMTSDEGETFFARIRTALARRS